MGSTGEERAVERIPYPYQIELYRMAKERNTIVCLGTGTGKTFIAILLMKDPEFASQLKGEYPMTAKRTFFLVPTRVLVKQQATEIEHQFSVKVKGYTGDMGVDFWHTEPSGSTWNKELAENQVLVMTLQILLDMISHCRIRWQNINLLVIDEVHWAAKKKGKKVSGHSYKQLMDLYKQCPERDRPRVLGLSASLINSSMKVELFEDAIKDLEETYCAVCNTSDVAQLCGTNPREVIWTFMSQASAPSSTATGVVKALDTFIDYLKTKTKGIKTDESVSVTVTRVRKCLTNIRNMLSDPIEKTITNPETQQKYIITMTWMGVWCASKAINHYIAEMSLYEEVYKHVNPNLSQMLTKVMSYLKIVDKVFVLELTADPMAALNTASPKMLRFLELLREYKPIGGQPSNLCGIAFVAQRSVAKVLAEWLTELKRIKPLEYDFLNVGWVVGHSNRPGFESLVTSFTDKQQEEIIDDFRDQKLNLIISTSVLEEGLDVSICNLVVRFDRINTFREYLQSKGRARADSARYYMMTSDEDSGALNRLLIDFRDMEKRIANLNSKPRHRGMDAVDDDDNSDDEETQYTITTGATISTRTAISLLYRYCGKLPSDSFTKLIPNFEISGVHSPYTSSVKLPLNCPLKTQIWGKECKTKKGAKKSAALEACIQLHKVGELDDHLLPISKDQFIDKYVQRLVGELDDHLLPISKDQFIDKYVQRLGLKINQTDDNTDCTSKPGTRSRTQIYTKRLAQELTPPDVKSNDHRIFGAITGRPIHNESIKFPVFVSVRAHLDAIRERDVSSKADVDFTPMQSIILTAEQKRLIEKFHVFTFDSVLEFGDESQTTFNALESKFNLLVVPLMNGSQIDWDFVNKINTCGQIDVKKVPLSERLDFKFDAEIYRDCVFTPWYERDIEGKSKFCDSLRITDKGLKSKWDGKDPQFGTYEGYYRKKYGLEISNKTQPLIEGRSVKKCAQLKPFVIGEVKSGKREYFVPELVTIHPFPSTLWRQALCLPAILYRVNHLLLAQQLRQTIVSETRPSIGSTQPKDRLALDLSSEVNEWSLSESKRVHSIEDLDVGCEGHPFDDAMDTSDAVVLKAQKKKQKTEMSIIINRSASSETHRNAVQPLTTSLNAITNISNNTLISSSNLVNITSAFINDFKCLLLNCQLSEFRSHEQEVEFINANSALIDANQTLNYGDSFPFVFTGDIKPHIKEEYDSRVNAPIVGPTADDLLRALTLLGASDAFNLERMETMGDSFLKFVTTGFLYYSCPELDEGRLSYLRQMQICNCNLYYIGKRIGLPDLMVAHMWFTHKNWLPPYYHITDECECQLLTDKENTTGAYRHQIVNDKSIADAVEALIGAHLLVGGNKSALIFMQWLGLRVSPIEDQIDYSVGVGSEPFQWLPPPKSPVWNTELSDSEVQTFIYREYNGCNLDHFEDIIGYKFRDKAFLIQAFTHSSNYFNVYTDCYQRLEFLGDAVLDYLITRHIFNLEDKKFSPGELTDLRSALVNNTFFASIAVKFRFHKFLKILSPDLFHAIEMFVKKFESNQVMAINNSFNKLNDEDVTDLEEVEVPKALGDIFESVAGAIYLDSGLSLDAVWEVYFKLIKPEIDYFSVNVPKMPVRELREHHKNVIFSPAEEVKGRKIRVVVTVDGRQFGGVGRNQKFAKIAASKIALLALKPKYSFNKLNDEDVTDLEEVEVPKALGDIFESVAGAIYLDSGLSLDAVWEVYFKLIKPEIDYFSVNVPKMPVRELREHHKNVIFSPAEEVKGRKIRVVVTVDGRQFGGVGRNQKFAKIAASKIALLALKRVNKSEKSEP
ncbi:unnamed protein product [Oppiella nova]|uniref:Dicer-2 n=1 Tax=Oppiella nova TaxID=334625 RepID=A0A7R9QNY8_9ACAR|nr:unnamed protein product [Oppiella nova]CAG2169667.1 unnamed protein product [Oppiella nova]